MTPAKPEVSTGCGLCALISRGTGNVVLVVEGTVRVALIEAQRKAGTLVRFGVVA